MAWDFPLEPICLEQRSNTDTIRSFNNLVCTIENADSFPWALIALPPAEYQALLDSATPPSEYPVHSMDPIQFELMLSVIICVAVVICACLGFSAGSEGGK